MNSVLGSKSASGTPFYASLILSLLWIIFYSSVNRCKVTTEALVHSLYQVLSAQVCHQLAKLLNRNADCLKFLVGLFFVRGVGQSISKLSADICHQQACALAEPGAFCLQATRRTYFFIKL